MSNQQGDALKLRKLQVRLAKCESAFLATTDSYAKTHIAEMAAEILQAIKTLQAGEEQKIYEI